MSENLTTVPSFIFDQLDKNNFNNEVSIQVAYYNGTIELTQNGQYINIAECCLKDFCKKILSNYNPAKEYLNNR